jgi:drug/metabolite transporter (DMT)-like permease
VSGKTVNSAMLLLILGNALALVSDVYIKILPEGAPVFQFIFIRTLITTPLLLLMYRMINLDAFFDGWRMHALRAQIHLVCIACAVVALGSLPLATANAIFYSAPIMVMLLSVVFFREQLTVLSTLAVASGFAGILVILRPIEIGWEALSAVIAAVGIALSIVLVRRLPAGQSVVHKLLLSNLFLLPACTVAMLIEDPSWDPLHWLPLARFALGSGVFIMAYNLTVLLAYRHVEAGKVTSAEYTGLIGAVLIGWIWFAEVPDVWFFLGTAMIVIPLLALGWKHRRRD